MSLGYTKRQRNFISQACTDGDLRGEIPTTIPLSLDLYGRGKRKVFGDILAAVVNHYGREGLGIVYNRFVVDKATFSNWLAQNGVEIVRRFTAPTRVYRKSRLMRTVEEAYQQPLEQILPDLISERGLPRTAEDIGVSKATLGYWLLKLGINAPREAVIQG